MYIIDGCMKVCIAQQDNRLRQYYNIPEKLCKYRKNAEFQNGKK